MKRKVSALFCAIFLITLTALPVSANSAQTYWEGISSTGAIVTDGDCPIVVEHELLTFDIPEFPENYYSLETPFVDYSASVRAQYSFYNPSDDTVTATLLFPFGHSPDYAPGEISDTAKYGVAVNGETIDTTLRHSYSLGFDHFDLETDLARLHDGFVDDPFYTPELTVTQYTYTVSGVDKEAYSAADAAFDWTNNGVTNLWLLEQSGFRRLDDGTARLSTWAENGRSVTLYAMGEPVEPEWTFYSNGALETEIPGTMTLTDTQILTFRDLALNSWSADSGVSESDWYNAVVAQFHDSSYGGGIIGSAIYSRNFDITHCLMYWYEYELTFAPGQRITNTVTAPLYPAINARYEPPVYTYTYLLSPAQTWTQFGTLEIVVNTPYYMTECETGEFSKTETGYTLTLDGLPEGELEFTLCSKDNPKKDVNYGYLKFYLVPIGIVFLIVVAGVVSIWKRVRKRK